MPVFADAVPPAAARERSAMSAVAVQVAQLVLDFVSLVVPLALSGTRAGLLVKQPGSKMAPQVLAKIDSAPKVTNMGARGGNIGLWPQKDIASGRSDAPGERRGRNANGAATD